MYNEETVGAPFLIGGIVALAQFIQRFHSIHSEERYLKHYVLWYMVVVGASGVYPPEEELTQ